MSLAKRDFFGKTVADAIQQACTALQTAQENLEIELVETGSTGIFGFIRKKAHIRARRKEEARQESVVADESLSAAQPVATAPDLTAGSVSRVMPKKAKPQPLAPAIPQEPGSAAFPVVSAVAGGPSAPEAVVTEEDEEDSGSTTGSQEPLSPESLDIIQQELSHLLQLMGMPSQIAVEAQGNSVRCLVSGDFQEALIGQEGRALDSVQYLLRKILAKKMSERARISIDVGEFKEKRRDELEAQAKELAVLVKENGKTQVIPSLNPSERRAVHMVLQDDKDIRSRSVGEGLFKKVLIYKPGKGKKEQSGENQEGSENAGNGAPAGPAGKKRSSSRGGRRRKGGKPAPEGSSGSVGGNDDSPKSE